MDTDNLSKEAYQGIILEAERLTRDLTIHYGVLAGTCENEVEYLKKAEELTKEIQNADEYELDDLFWGNPPELEKLNKTLNKILENINLIQAIPIEKRRYDY